MHYFPDIYFSLWYILYVIVIVLLNAYVLIKYVIFRSSFLLPTSTVIISLSYGVWIQVPFFKEEIIFV